MTEEDFITVDSSLSECTMPFFKLVECVWTVTVSRSLLYVLTTTLQNVIKLIIFFID